MKKIILILLMLILGIALGFSLGYYFFDGDRNLEKLPASEFSEKLREENNNNDNNINGKNENEAGTNEEELDQNNDAAIINLDYVTKEDEKVNIYFFWGDGCPHCEKEFEFFDSIKDTYGDYYNLYTFETWKNDENAKLLDTFSDAMEVEASGVPYTIVGEEVIVGFGESTKEKLVSAIEKESKKSFDVYFDKLL